MIWGTQYSPVEGASSAYGYSQSTYVPEYIKSTQMVNGDRMYSNETNGHTRALPNQQVPPNQQATYYNRTQPSQHIRPNQQTPYYNQTQPIQHTQPSQHTRELTKQHIRPNQQVTYYNQTQPIQHTQPSQHTRELTKQHIRPNQQATYYNQTQPIQPTQPSQHAQPSQHMRQYLPAGYNSNGTHPSQMVRQRQPTGFHGAETYPGQSVQQNQQTAYNATGTRPIRLVQQHQPIDYRSTQTNPGQPIRQVQQNAHNATKMNPNQLVQQHRPNGYNSSQPNPSQLIRLNQPTGYTSTGSYAQTGFNETETSQQFHQNQQTGYTDNPSQPVYRNANAHYGVPQRMSTNASQLYANRTGPESNSGNANLNERATSVSCVPQRPSNQRIPGSYYAQQQRLSTNPDQLYCPSRASEPMIQRNSVPMMHSQVQLNPDGLMHQSPRVIQSRDPPVAQTCYPAHMTLNPEAKEVRTNRTSDEGDVLNSLLCQEFLGETAGNIRPSEPMDVPRQVQLLPKKRRWIEQPSSGEKKLASNNPSPIEQNIQESETNENLEMEELTNNNSFCETLEDFVADCDRQFYPEHFLSKIRELCSEMSELFPENPISTTLPGKTNDRTDSLLHDLLASTSPSTTPTPRVIHQKSPSTHSKTSINEQSSMAHNDRPINSPHTGYTTFTESSSSPQNLPRNSQLAHLSPAVIEPTRMPAEHSLTSQPTHQMTSTNDPNSIQSMTPVTCSPLACQRTTSPYEQPPANSSPTSHSTIIIEPSFISTDPTLQTLTLAKSSTEIQNMSIDDEEVSREIVSNCPSIPSEPIPTACATTSENPFSKPVVYWVLLDDVEIPCISREDGLFAPFKYVEKKLFSKFPDCPVEELSIYPMTGQEAVVLNKHASGEIKFSGEEFVVPLKSLEVFHKELKKKIEQRANVAGGFLQVNNTLVPYFNKSNTSFFSLSILVENARLLCETNIDRFYLATPSEVAFLNQLCYSIGIVFDFSKYNKFIELPTLISNCEKTPEIGYLESEYPFDDTKYIDAEEVLITPPVGEHPVEVVTETSCPDFERTDLAPVQITGTAMDFSTVPMNSTDEQSSTVSEMNSDVIPNHDPGVNVVPNHDSGMNVVSNRDPGMNVVPNHETETNVVPNHDAKIHGAPKQEFDFSSSDSSKHRQNNANGSSAQEGKSSMITDFIRTVGGRKFIFIKRRRKEYVMAAAVNNRFFFKCPSHLFLNCLSKLDIPILQMSAEEETFFSKQYKAKSFANKYIISIDDLLTNFNLIKSTVQSMLKIDIDGTTANELRDDGDSGVVSNRIPHLVANEKNDPQNYPKSSSEIQLRDHIPELFTNSILDDAVLETTFSTQNKLVKCKNEALSLYIKNNVAPNDLESNSNSIPAPIEDSGHENQIKHKFNSLKNVNEVEPIEYIEID